MVTFIPNLLAPRFHNRTGYCRPFYTSSRRPRSTHAAVLPTAYLGGGPLGGGPLGGGPLAGAPGGAPGAPGGGPRGGGPLLTERGFVRVNQYPQF